MCDDLPPLKSASLMTFQSILKSSYYFSDAGSLFPQNHKIFTVKHTE